MTARAGPPRERDPSTIAMIVLESGHYCQVQITPHLQESHWSLEAVDSMLPANTALPDNPTALPNDQPPDPLTAIVSGAAGTWHPGHALYCLWRWARRRWSHTRNWTETWRFHLQGRQQLEAIPQRERTAETPTATNLCPVFAIHQIRALAMGGQLQPAIRTETEAQAAHAALVHEILSALRSALVRRVGNFPGPRTTASRNREHTLMNTRGNTVRTAPPHRHGTRVPCPPQPVTGSAATTHRRANTVGIPQRPPASEETTRQPRDHLVLPEAPKMDVKPAAAEPAVNRDDRGKPTLPKRTPSYNPTTCDRARHSTNACRSGTPAAKPSTCPAYAAVTQRIRASLSGP